jgi:hypothetical protein
MALVRSVWAAPFSGLATLLLIACTAAADRTENGRPLARAPEPPACVDEGDSAPQSIVRALYRTYLPRYAPGLGNEPKEILSKYFDDVLTEMFLRDQECRERSQGMCDLDVDVLVGANSVEVTNLRLCVQRGSRTEVLAEFLNSGRETTVRFEVRKSGRDWKVTDITIGSKSLRAFALRKP